MMLQQTRVATVIPYFQRWMARFPTLAALAAANEDDVLHAWQGLGYYSRARNLLRGARAVMERHAGVVPSDPELLRALPGIGPYTAGAIASVAYNVPAPIVDGNVIRVLCRLFALRGDPARQPLRSRLWELAEVLIPEGSASEFNPALMEFGATLCTPARPRCGECPLEPVCEARRLDLVELLPETAARPQVTTVRMAAAVVWRDEQLLVQQRPPDADRWAGMWEFPNGELDSEESAQEGAFRVLAAIGMQAEVGQRVVVIRHAVTRYQITLEAFHCHAPKGEPEAPDGATRWISVRELDSLALPAAHRRIADRLAGPVEMQLELGIGNL
jgi:A/G-specific adenine glycosylase